MRRLLALLLCLMLLPCAALAADDTVLVVIEEGSGFTVAKNGLRVLPGEDAVFTVTMERGVLLTGTDYAGDTAIEESGRTITLTLRAVQYPTRVRLSISTKYATITYDANGGTPMPGEEAVVQKRVSMTVHPRPNTESGVNLFQREGYTLISWNTRSDGQGTRIGLGSRATPVNGTLRLYAQWAQWTDASCFDWAGEDEITITGYHGDDTVIVIPARLGNGTVTRIAAGAFTDCAAEEIILPDFVREVEDGAFTRCALHTLTFRDNIEVLSDLAFADCPNLQTLRINAVEAPFGYVYRKESVYADKVELLQSAQGKKKIVFYGGCSMWYNLDAYQAARTFGDEYVIIDMGLNGTASSAVQLQILLNYLEPGDILLHTPELSSRQQLMLRLDMGDNDSSLWAGIENNYDLLTLVDKRTVTNLLDSFTHYLSLKDRRTSYQSAYADDDGNSYFDVFGTLPFFRSGTQASLPDRVFLDPEMLSGDALDTLAQYYELLTSRGVRVYVSFACVNVDALPEGDLAHADAVEAILRERTEALENVTLISHLSDYLYHQSDFYDTNYHLCTVPARENTARWLRDLTVQMAADGLWEDAP